MRSFIASSYNQNQGGHDGNYGNLFYGITTLIDPKVVVELGVCQGYSSAHIAKGIKDCGGTGKLYCYDLWRNDEGKTNFHKDQVGQHLTSTKKQFKDRLISLGLLDFVEINTKEVFSVLENYDTNSVDLIHVDVGNCGSVLSRLVFDVNRVLKLNKYFLFEGGAAYRDDVSWMKKYEKASIKKELEENKILSDNFEYMTFYEYPSLTVARKVK